MRKKLGKGLLLLSVLITAIAAVTVCVLFTVNVREEAKQRLVTVAEFLAGQLETGTTTPASLQKCITSRCFSFIIFTRFHNGAFVPIPGAAFPENYTRYLPQPDDPVVHFDRAAAPEYFNPAIERDGILAIMVPLQFRQEEAFCAIGIPEPRLDWHKYFYMVLLFLLPWSVLLLLAVLPGEPPKVTPSPPPVRRSDSAAGQILQLGRLVALRQVITGIIHEINQPLCVIKGYLGLLQMMTGEKKSPSEEDETMMKYLDICLQNLDRTEATLEHIRKFVRDGIKENVVVEVNPIIKNIIEFFGEQFHQRSIRLSVQLPEKSPKIKIVGTFLEQALINLLANARDSFSDTGSRSYEGSGRQVTITVDDDRAGVRIGVEDNGGGMTPEVLAHCTEPFYSAGSENAGIGLSMCKAVVERFGGSMKIGSIRGRGTTINLVFPHGAAETANPGGEHAVA